MKIKAVLFGATGMVGEGVLHECLKHPDVVSVVVVNRQPCSVKHEKLNEIIHSNFHDFSEIEDRLSGYNAGFFCMGVSSIRMKEDDYRRITYDLTIHVAETLLKHNPHMTFCYVSGAGTDSSENGKVMWARVKGKTENDLLKMAFKSAYMFRPGYIQPTKGLKNAYKIYRYLSPFYPVWKTLFPSYVCTLKEIGLAMISVV
ncbi:MAG: NAD-dependent epimerase/dehydratase family protein, partial [Calditrichaceae bacterium]